MYNFEDFAKSVNNQAWLAAFMLKQNGITPTLADTNEGKGSVISHNAVSRYWAEQIMLIHMSITQDGVTICNKCMN